MYRFFGRRSPRTAAGALAGLALATAQTPEQLVTAGRLDEAIGIYQTQIQTSPNNPALLLNLSIAEYKNKSYQDSITHAKAALKLQPGLVPAQLFLGASHIELKEFPAAIQPLEIVVAANPTDRNARLMLGQALLETNNPKEAIPHLIAAAELLPANPHVWYNLARAQEAMGRSATEAWDKLSALPPSLESHLRAAQVQDAAQRWREAASEWRRALALAPEDQPARLGLAWALFRARDYEAAMSELKPLLVNKQPEVQFLYGASLLNLQQPAAAIPYLRAAITITPAQAALGQALLQTGKPEEAIPLLKNAAGTDTDGNIHFQLFRAYQLTHRDIEANEALAAYRRLRAH